MPRKTKTTRLFDTLHEAAVAAEEEETKTDNRGKRISASTYRLQLSGELKDNDPLHKLLNGDAVYCIGTQPQQMSRGLMCAIGLDLSPISRRGLKSNEMQKIQSDLEKTQAENEKLRKQLKSLRSRKQSTETKSSTKAKRPTTRTKKQ